ncbi:MAG: hypothetical protein JSW10_01530 [Pseudomonadota bacterium]|nr:MAG: hypothetical protein JSW10_01530 [Pseudomonadota bacterium]
MDRRTELRRTARVKAYLCRSGSPPVRCETTNISASGVHVQTVSRRGAFALREGETLSLFITLDFSPVVKAYHRRATVTHRTEHGFGLRTYRINPPASPTGRMPIRVDNTARERVIWLFNRRRT